MKAPIFRTASVRRGDEPSAAELRAIEAEWPLIAAEIAVVDAEAALAAGGRHAVEIDYRRLRRAERRVLGIARRSIGSSTVAVTAVRCGGEAA